MTALEIIATKREGGRLSREAIEYFIGHLGTRAFSDHQAVALLMAICCRGLDLEETTWLTEAMVRSGSLLRRGPGGRRRVDKHSTGGVGDKTSLILAPVGAALGLEVPMISGRGLGHTGGTLDKMEAIPGLRTDLSPEQIARQLHEVGCVIAAQTESLVPADRRLYALRDVTGTVPNQSLIAASILSKKLAEDLDGLVLDVKFGAGAFMREVSSARALAALMVGIGQGYGCPCVALLTSMDTPLGRAAGNAVEVEEVVRCLQGDWPPDLEEVTRALLVEMAGLAGMERQEAESGFARAIRSGQALEVFCRLVAAQGGEVDSLLRPGTGSNAPCRKVLTYEGPPTRVVGLDAMAVARAALALGAGRLSPSDPVDPWAGLAEMVKPGDRVERGQTLAVLHSSVEAGFGEAEARFRQGLLFGEVFAGEGGLIHERIG